MRAKLLSKRRGLDRVWVEKQSMEIGKKILATREIIAAENILIYLPVHKEVETKFIIDELFALGKSVYIPAYKSKGYIIGKFPNWEDLEAGPYGILQPKAPIAAEVNVIEAAILPGIGFDLFGNRLGYGKGVYDQLLTGSRAFKIALAFDFQIVDKLPVRQHDIAMDMIVTERRAIRC